MITVFCAMYAEAAMLIKHYGLKQNHNFTNFSIFENEDAPVRVMLTGVGEIKTAAAVGAAGILFSPKSDDVFVNFGICRGNPSQKGKCFLINKITEQTTGRTFYPDMMVKSNLSEVSLTTVSEVVTGNIASEKDTLYDMEAAAVYQAGSLYAGPHQMVFIKLVSDAGETVDPKEVSALIQDKEKEICGCLDHTAAYASMQMKKEFVLDPTLSQMRSVLTESLHCSDYMEKETHFTFSICSDSRKET